MLLELHLTTNQDESDGGFGGMGLSLRDATLISNQDSLNDYQIFLNELN